MRRYWFFLVVICSVFCLPFTTMGAQPVKIGVVDVKRCIHESVKGKKAYEELKEKKESMQKRLDKKQQELLKLKEDLEKQSMMLSMDAKEEKKREFEQKKQEFRYLYEDLSKEMQQAEAKATKGILEELKKVIEKIGEQRDFLMILEMRRSGVIYFKDKIEITDDVIKAYNKMQ